MKRHTIQILSQFTCAAGIVVMLGTKTFATVYDSFENYTLGDINGQNAGSDWTSAWSANESVDVVSSSLSYSNGSVSVNGGTQAMQVGGSSDLIFSRTFAASDTGDAVYFSMLFRHESGGPGNWLQMFISDDTAYNSSSGSFGDLDQSSNRLGLRAYGPGGAYSQSSASETYADDTTYFLVGRLSSNGSAGAGDELDLLELWLNPDSQTLGSPIVSIERAMGINGSTADTFGARTYNMGASDAFLIDELRIGSTVDAVVIPEPSSATLLLGAFAGAGAFAFCRRR
ncbi:PEP-CTERM sorting domain-containing protein [Puniceicoccus vermicola]|uniref:Ice-binding protein C-terminal domain-containing protein n=1 Tax=Puniceicoccus vermicola TaxID=388746 RepID=A0A7X1B1A6_9BACT|nr:PEP-CTERM sorting domain-containing protein [Puniceicoccus vermicola]MBC2603790.1 hypothetical protein [Puniceicoccus vermicola]